MFTRLGSDNAAGEEKLVKKNSFFSSCCSFWKNTHFRNNLNIITAITAGTDLVIDLLCAKWSEVESFILDDVPYPVRSLFYLLPSLAPYMPALCCKYSNEEDGAESKNDLPQVLIDYKREESITAFINFWFSSFRAAQGIAILMQGSSAVSREDGERTIGWIDFASDAGTVIYCASVVWRSLRGRKNTIDRANALAKLQVLDTVSIETETKATQLAGQDSLNQTASPQSRIIRMK
jgi:hypothetical protein